MSTVASTRAHQLYERAQQVIPGGVTSSFRAAVKPEPFFADHAQGAEIFDADGLRHLDFALAWGPLILGHGHPAVIAAVREQLDHGHMYGAQHELEARVAERMRSAVPCAGLVTFSSSGTEAAMVALRVARAYTGRHRILKFEGHYHGWSDGALASYHADPGQMGTLDDPRPVPGMAGQAPGALQDIVVVPWNDLDRLEATLRRYGAEIAAVIMEPVLCNSGVISPEPGYLESAQALARANGSLLIFDEVITGFRLAAGGAQERYGITPDLAVYAKAIAAGFPLSAIAGRREVMDVIACGAVRHSGSYNGNPISMAAADAALQELCRPGVFDHLNRLGALLADGARGLLERHGLAALVHQAGPVMQILFTTQTKVADYRAFAACDAAMSEALVLHLRERGILILPDGRWYLSAVHTEAHVQEALQALDDSLASMARE
ncbi:MAG TPA: aspartate aminotransferase family protein [Chloroflexota bacterium]|nr:aspartate aminotransferase family protein [Chloroflexota bacterium]